MTLRKSSWLCRSAGATSSTSEPCSVRSRLQRDRRDGRRFPGLPGAVEQEIRFLREEQITLPRIGRDVLCARRMSVGSQNRARASLAFTSSSVPRRSGGMRCRLFSESDIDGVEAERVITAIGSARHTHSRSARLPRPVCEWRRRCPWASSCGSRRAGLTQSKDGSSVGIIHFLTSFISFTDLFGSPGRGVGERMNETAKTAKLDGAESC